MRAVALRRQLLVAGVAIAGVVVGNAIAGSLAAKMVVPSILFVLMCLAPAAFAWNLRAYRVAASLLAVVFTALGAFVMPLLLPAAIVAWLTLLPIRLPAAA